MLYITTRGQKDAYTAHRALCNNYAPDGGCFVPFKMPQFNSNDLMQLQDKSFGEVISEIVNTFFAAGLTGWDIDLCAGKTPIQLHAMSHRVCIAENWHNPKGEYSYIVNNISNKLRNEDTTPSLWTATVVRIATLFALYAQMLHQRLIELDQTFDIAVNGDDFFEPIAAWYARKLGLPIETIIVTCVDDGIVWDTIHRGVFPGGSIENSLKMNLEHLLSLTLGFNAVSDFDAAQNKGRAYAVCEALLPMLNKGLFCSVVGTNRAEATVSSVYRSNGYILDPAAARSYGGMQDYRAKTGSTNMTLVLSDVKPLDFNA